MSFASAPALRSTRGRGLRRRLWDECDELVHRALQRRCRSVDISNWTLTEHPTQQAIFSAVKIPSGTRLAAGGFYVLGLSNSGLAVPARAGNSTIYVRTTSGMTAGDSISIDTGSNAETRKIVSVGTVASNNTTLWQPLPDGPILKIPAGSTNVPVTSLRHLPGHQTSRSARRSPSATAAPIPPSQEPWSDTRWPRSLRSASRARKPSWGRTRPPARPTSR